MTSFEVSQREASLETKVKSLMLRSTVRILVSPPDVYELVVVLVSQACDGQDEDEDCGSTACVDVKFNNIESMIYQRGGGDVKFLGYAVGWVVCHASDPGLGGNPAPSA
ncbi:hypothetical protein L3X38_018657 [Prunus dulcis]|uniref:Uncharacterized protein n=1 Tax=Prunus dulcis TaxID=3755 RepID=A0AAD4ZAY5_PRUDU|nr:hypothetical protein L3X38_018657 [Prunus dulcis]